MVFSTFWGVSISCSKSKSYLERAADFGTHMEYIDTQLQWKIINFSYSACLLLKV